MPYGVYTPGIAADEVSSTYEGRHLTFSESQLTHPDHTGEEAADLVNKGDPVVVGAQIVGVAFLGGVSLNTELIPIDTEGIWQLSVVAVDDAGNSAVAVGDELFINTTTCIISKISSPTTNIPFGYALYPITSGATDVIPVKVHFDLIDPVVVYGDKTYAGMQTYNGIGIHNAAEYYASGVNVSGLGIFNSGISVAGTTTVQALVAGGGASVAGTTDLQTVIVHSSLAVASGGLLTFSDGVDATLLPAADPAVAGRLWSNAGVITRSAG